MPLLPSLRWQCRYCKCPPAFFRSLAGQWAPLPPSLSCSAETAGASTVMADVPAQDVLSSPSDFLAVSKSLGQFCPHGARNWVRCFSTATASPILAQLTRALLKMPFPNNLDLIRELPLIAFQEAICLAQPALSGTL